MEKQNSGNATSLQIKDLCMSFGGIQALDGVSFSVSPGTIHGIIGPNGAGKTTLINCISGQFTPSGSIRYGDHELTRLRAHERIGLGIARTFQHINIYGELSVLDNVKIGGHHRLQSRWLHQCLYWGPFGCSREETRLHNEAMVLLETLDMEDVAELPAGELSYGQQKRLEIGRALLGQPSLLLLDEPMAGMSRQEKNHLSEWIRQISRDLSVTILMIEHDMSVIQALTEQVVVLDFGRKIAEGTPREVVQDQRVRIAYLGEE